MTDSDIPDEYTAPIDPFRKSTESELELETPEVSIIEGVDGQPVLKIRQESSEVNYTVKARLFDDYLPHLMNEFAQYIDEHGVEE